MENKSLNRFVFVFGISVFIILTLGLLRLFRFAIVAFGVLGFILFVWSLFLVRDDEKSKETVAQRKRKGRTPLEKKLAKEISNCASEVETREKNIKQLEEKAAYFIRKIFGEFDQMNDDHAVFIEYANTKRKYGSKVSLHLVENCDTIVNQHREEIDLNIAEVHYWKTLERKYDQAFDSVAEAQQQIDKLKKQLQTKKKKAEADERLNKEMQSYMEAKFTQDSKHLEDELYQNEHFSDVHAEVKQQLETFQEQLEQANRQIEHFELVTNNYHELQKQNKTTKTGSENGLAEEVRKLSEELEQIKA